MKAVNVLLFDGFTTMDALGPAEALSRVREGEQKCYEIEILGCWRTRGQQYGR